MAPTVVITGTAVLVQIAIVAHAASENDWNVTVPAASIGVSVTLSFSVASPLAVPEDKVAIEELMLTTQSHGSEFGSRDG